MISMTFGSDPEFMILDGNNLKSAIEILKSGSMDRIEHDGNQFYYDNVLAECAIKPSSNKAEAIDNFRKCFAKYAELVKPYKIEPMASANYPDDQLKHDHARVVGCQPDSCVYSMQSKTSPFDAIENSNFRTGGGHVHIGNEVIANGGKESIALIYLMDLFLGIPSLWIDKDPTSSERRRIYGEAGRFRSKPYGAEYRSLSNFWLSSPAHVAFVYDMSQFILEICCDEKALAEYMEFDIDKFSQTQKGEDLVATKYDHNLVIKCINDGDKSKTEGLMDLIYKKIPDEIKNQLEELKKIPKLDFYQAWDI